MTRVRLKTSNIAPALDRKIKGLDSVPKSGYDHFKQITPIRSGNARRRTRLQGSTIKADYPYAVRLDEGWSKQAPKGMVQPTIEFMSKLVNKIMRSN